MLIILLQSRVKAEIDSPGDIYTVFNKPKYMGKTEAINAEFDMFKPQKVKLFFTYTPDKKEILCVS